MTRLLARAANLFVCSFIVILTGAAIASAEAPFTFDGTPGKLPKTVVPIRYSIDLSPDFQDLTFTGSQVVEIEVRAPTDTLVLHAVDLTIASASIEGLGPAASVALDQKADTATITLPQTIGAGRHRLHMSFSGRINTRRNRGLYGRGLFATDYQIPGGRKRMIATNLEPAEARRIFPSWDEPSFKAIFELHVTVSDKLLAVSNMPVAREQPAGAGLKRVSFEPTPKMSTYLFVLAAGELERVTVEAEGVTVGVVTTEGKSQYAQYALTSASNLLKYFNDYFGVKYALPKVDMIAIPGGIGFGGAMENWGGITFDERGLLFDPKRNSEASRQGIFMTIAHELAHQWFGNLVTMAWWDNLWLNEGFATWMQVKATDVLNPDWDIWLAVGHYKQHVMKKDAGRSARAIRQPVVNDKAAMATFDDITYGKGMALIRMAEAYLGEEVFRSAIRQYIAKHAYSNATSADLWHALEAASGKPVTAIADQFIGQAGIPLVVADGRCVDGGQRMQLRQERFAIKFPDAEPHRWQVPILFGPVRAGQSPERALLDGASEILVGRCDEPAKLNLGDTGYYRVKYDPATQAALEKAFGVMTPVDQANLLADISALSEAGLITVAARFDLIEQAGRALDAVVIREVIRTFEQIDLLARGRPGQNDFHASVRATLRPVFDRLGWSAQASESVDRVMLRAKVIETLGRFGDEAIVAEAKRRFDAFLRDPPELDKDLRDPVIHLVGRHADRATYDTLVRLARESALGDEATRYYLAAASALDPVIAREMLAVALNDELPPDLASDLIERVAQAHRELAWDFVRANFSELVSKQGPQFRDVFVANLMSNFTDRARADELATFAPVHETPEGRISAARAREEILANSVLAEQELPAVADWVRRRAARP